MKSHHILALRWMLLALIAACLILYSSALTGTATLVYVLIAVLTVSVAAILTDAQIGFFAGLVGAAAVIGIQRSIGEWTTAFFGLHLLVAVLLVSLGVCAGKLGSILRMLAAGSDASTGVDPAFGSMGLLRDVDARRRIDAEIVRARIHDRPLSLLVIDVLIDPSVDIDTRHTTQRAVVRLIESLLRPTDLPFAFSAHEFGVILPETDRQSAWHVSAPLIDALSHTTLPAESAQRRIKLTEIASIRTAFTEVDQNVASSSDLITTARDALEGLSVDLRVGGGSGAA